MARLGSRLGAANHSRRAQPWEVAVFAWIPGVVLAAVIVLELGFGHSLGDFAIFRDASKAVLHGHSPFVAVDPHALSQNDKFVYPPATAFLFAPFALLPLEVARAVMLVASAAAVVLALRLLRVSDWRCYGLALASAPALGSVAIGALSPFLLVAASVAWRVRERPVTAGASVALAATAKLFLWPLGVWLLATRRLRSAGTATVASAVVVVGGWAAIGFAGFAAYPHLLRVLADVEAPEGYSLVGLMRLEGGAATALSAALALVGAAATVAAARGPDGDRRSFSVAVTTALVATPVLWMHYFVLLLVPLALYRPRLSPLWFAPLGWWLTPFAHSDGVPWRTAFALTLAVALVGRLVFDRPQATRQITPAMGTEASAAVELATL